MKHKKKIMIGVGVIALFIVCGIGISYSLWSKTFIQTNENTLVSDCFHIVFEEVSGSGIQLENTFPIMDQEGKKLKPYEFSIQNKCKLPVEYQINFEILKETTLNHAYVKIMFQENSPVLLNTLEPTEVTLNNGVSAYRLEKGYLDAEETKNYNLRMWMDESVTQNTEGAMNAIFLGKVTIKASYLTKYVEPILNGADPVLKDGLIPVVIADNGEVRKAYDNEEWYKYEEKRWANAVVLNDESVHYQSGETIPESNIESYFVWIPRYRYKIFNDGNYPTQSGTLVDNKLPSSAQEIEIVFENKDTNVSSGSTVGSFLTHPAFTSFNTNGMWVGKFETGYKGSTDTTDAEKNVVEPGSVQIKPNVNSWRNIQVSNAFYTSYDYKRDYNSHMMKNTEWGAISYLQHSKYGSMVSVRINNNSEYITGYSAVNEPTCGDTATNEECNKYGTDSSITQAYNTATGYLASTTANITGVYDMSGGSWEYVMGVMLDKNGKPMSGRNSKYNSGFNGTFGCPTCDGDTSGLTTLTTGKPFPSDTRCYDTYQYAENDETYNRSILGDATGEMGPFATATYGSQQRQIGSWYADESWFVVHWNPWFGRGYNFGVGNGAGVFTFVHDNGHANSYASFRVVLSI